MKKKEGGGEEKEEEKAGMYSSLMWHWIMERERERENKRKKKSGRENLFSDETEVISDDEGNHTVDFH